MNAVTDSKLKEKLQKRITTVKTAIAEFPLPDTKIEYTFAEAEDKDWNE